MAITIATQTTRSNINIYKPDERGPESLEESQMREQVGRRHPAADPPLAKATEMPLEKYPDINKHTLANKNGKRQESISPLRMNNSRRQSGRYKPRGRQLIGRGEMIDCPNRHAVRTEISPAMQNKTQSLKWHKNKGTITGNITPESVTTYEQQEPTNDQFGPHGWLRSNLNPDKLRKKCISDPKISSMMQNNSTKVQTTDTRPKVIKQQMFTNSKYVRERAGIERKRNGVGRRPPAADLIIPEITSHNTNKSDGKKRDEIGRRPSAADLILSNSTCSTSQNKGQTEITTNQPPSNMKSGTEARSIGRRHPAADTTFTNPTTQMCGPASSITNQVSTYKNIECREGRRLSAADPKDPNNKQKEHPPPFLGYSHFWNRRPPRTTSQ